MLIEPLVPTWLHYVNVCTMSVYVWCVCGRGVFPCADWLSVKLLSVLTGTAVCRLGHCLWSNALVMMTVSLAETSGLEPLPAADLTGLRGKKASCAKPLGWRLLLQGRRESQKEEGLACFQQQSRDQYWWLTGQSSGLYSKSLPVMMDL